MDIIISDFDNTLFKRNYGIIERSVAKVATYGCPVVVISWRAPDQQSFIQETLDGTGLNVVGLVLLGDRSKDPLKKYEAAIYLSKKSNIVAAIDDDTEVCRLYQRLGIRIL